MKTQSTTFRRWLRMRDLDKNGGGATPFGKSYIYSELKAGRWPKPVEVAPGIKAWRMEDIEAEMQRRVALYSGGDAA